MLEIRLTILAFNPEHFRTGARNQLINIKIGLAVFILYNTIVRLFVIYMQNWLQLFVDYKGRLWFRILLCLLYELSIL